MYQQQSLRSTSNFQLSKSRINKSNNLEYVQEPARTTSGFYKQHDKIQKNYEYQLEKYLKLKQSYPKTIDQKQSYYHNQTPKEKNSSFIDEQLYKKPIHMNTLAADSQSMHYKYTDSSRMTQSKVDFYKDDHKPRNQGRIDEKIRVENDYNNTDYWNKTGYYKELHRNQKHENHTQHYTYQLQDKLRMDYNNTINNRSQIEQSIRKSEILNNRNNNNNNNNNYTDKIKVESDYNIDKVKKPVVSNTMQYMKERDQIMASLLTQEEVKRLKQKMVGRF